MSKPIREYWIGWNDPEVAGRFGDPYISESQTEKGIHVIEHSAYLKLLDANKKLRDALEIICDPNHGKDCDLIADKVAKLALSEADKIEGGS